jgi:hypothetical protein
LAWFLDKLPVTEALLSQPIAILQYVLDHDTVHLQLRDLSNLSAIDRLQQLCFMQLPAYLLQVLPYRKQIELGYVGLKFAWLLLDFCSNCHFLENKATKE